MGIIRLLRGVDIDSNYQHSIDFDTIALQEAYFTSKTEYYTDKFLQIKDTTSSIFKTFLIQQTASILKVEIPIDDARTCNYLMFKNDDSDKWYYAFIKQTYYLNEAVTIIEYEIDVVQTFLFDYSIHCAHIDREHQDRWRKSLVPSLNIPVYNIQPENLNLGEDLLVKGTQRLCDYADEENKIYLMWCCFLFTKGSATGQDIDYDLNGRICKFMGNQTLYACFLPLVIGVDDPESNCKFLLNGTNSQVLTANKFLQVFATNPNLFACEVLPYLPNTDTLTVEYSYNAGTNLHTFNITTDKYDTAIARSNTGGSYTLYYFQSKNEGTISYERNLGSVLNVITGKSFTPSPSDLANMDNETKLLTAPYRFASLVTNNDKLDVKYENIPSGARIMGRLSYYATVINQIYIENYLGDTTNNFKSLIDRTINELPLKTDAYINYLYTQRAQAQNQMSMGMIKSGASFVGGLGTVALGYSIAGGASVFGGNPMGVPMMLSGLMAMGGSAVSMLDAVGKLNAKVQDLQTTPQSLERYGNDGTFGLYSKTIVPTMYYLEIKPQFKEIAYNFFRLFGYKSNRFVGSPNDFNIRSRYYYNYIKTANIELTLPFNKDYQDKLAQIFNNGITFWHNRASMQDFELFNYTNENWEVSLL